MSTLSSMLEKGPGGPGGLAGASGCFTASPGGLGLPVSLI